MKGNTKDILISTGLKESTAEKYIYDLSKVEELTECDIDDFTIEDFQHFTTILVTRPVEKRFWRGTSKETASASTIRAYMYSLKSYWHATKQKEKVEWINDYKMPKLVLKKRKVDVDFVDVPAFCESIWLFDYTGQKKPKTKFIEYRDKFMVVFSYFLATRRSEIIKVKLEDVNRERQTVVVEATKGGGDRSGSARVEMSVPAMLFWDNFDEYMAIRDEYSMEDAQWLFPTQSGMQMDVNAIYIVFRKFDSVLKEYIGSKESNMTPHVMRRSLAIRAAKTLSVKDGMTLTRHKTPGAFMIYSEEADMKDSAERIKNSKIFEGMT